MNLKGHTFKSVIGLVVGFFFVSTTVHALIPNDPFFKDQYYLDRTSLPAAWDILLKNVQDSTVIIAILDTGIDISHPDLVNNIWQNTDEIPGDGIDNDGNTYIDDYNGWDFVESIPDPSPKIGTVFDIRALQHGTVVAGIAAATVNNLKGIAGASYQAKIMPLRILDSSGAGNTIILSQAIEYAVANGADIINLSLVGDEADPRVSEAIELAYRNGVAVVAASGNQEALGVDLNVNKKYPVCEFTETNRVLGVAAVDQLNSLSTFSNYGSNCIDIAAPGNNLFSTTIPSADLEDNLGYYSDGWSGTSVAAPLVSGTVALIMQIAPNLSLEKIYSAIRASAKSLQPYNPDVYHTLGAGLLDSEKALRLALQMSRTRNIFMIFGADKGAEPYVTIRNKHGERIRSFLAYNVNFKGGVTITTGDVTGDGKEEIITAPRSNGGPHVRIFDLQGTIVSEFMAYNHRYSGGLSITTADIDDDRRMEIIVAQLNGSPLIRVFDFAGHLKYQFLAYHPDFIGGVNISSIDIDRDGHSEIVTAPASNGGPHILIYSPDGKVKGQFMAYDSAMRGGYNVYSGDVDGDDWDELLIKRSDIKDPSLKIFNVAAVEKNNILLFPQLGDSVTQVNIAVEDYTGDRRPEILSLSAEDRLLRIFDYFGQIIDTIIVTNFVAGERDIPFSIIRE